MFKLKSLARVFAILYCCVIYYCSAITHTVCVQLSDRTLNDINVETKSELILYSDLRKELVTREIITSSNNFYFMKKNVKIELEDEEYTIYKPSKQCASLKNPNERKIKICKLSGKDNSENHCIMTNVNTHSATGIVVSKFRDEVKLNLLQDPPCVDWRFVKFLAKSENNSIERLYAKNLLKPEDEEMITLNNIILVDDTVYALNFFDVNQTDIIANRGGAYDMYNFRINPYLSLGDLRKMLDGTRTCEGTSIRNIIPSKLNEKEWRVLKRDYTWQNDGNFLDERHKLDPDLVLTIHIENITPIWKVLYTGGDNKVYIDYHNILNNRLHFIGMQTDFIWNPDRTVGVRALKRNPTDACIDPINLANLRTISEKHPSYMNNVFLAENGTDVMIEIQNEIFEEDKLYSIDLNDHEENMLAGIVTNNKHSIIRRYAGGEHISLKMLDSTITELSMRHNKMQFEVSIQEIRKKRHTRSVSNVRVDIKDTVDGRVDKSNSKDDPSTFNLVNMKDYEFLGKPEKVVFFVLIFKDHEVALRTLRLVPKNTNMYDGA